MGNLCIKELNMSLNNRIDDGCMKLLGEYIRSNQFIEEVDLKYTQISDTGIKALQIYIDGNKTFKRLNIIANKRITDLSIPAFLKMIESSHMEDVLINDTSITKNNILAVPLACNIIKYGLSKLVLREK